MHVREAGLKRAACKALSKGMPMAEAKGALRRWLTEALVKHGKSNMTAIRQGMVFVIHEWHLITVLFLPGEFRSQVAKWHARNPASANHRQPPQTTADHGKRRVAAGSPPDPHSGAMTPESPQPPLKSASKPLKSPVLAETRPTVGGNDEIRMTNDGRSAA